MSFLSIPTNYCNNIRPAHTHNTYIHSETSARIVDNTKKENNLSVSCDKKIEEVWRTNFEHNFKHNVSKTNEEPSYKASWANEYFQDIQQPQSLTQTVKPEVKMETDNNEVINNTPNNSKSDDLSPPHHARRPMNAFLIFCKKHRPIVRQKYPNLENRGVTRILGEWWALLNFDEKLPYTDLAKEYKDAFLSANPNFKWYKLPAPPLRTLSIRPPIIHQKISPKSPPCDSYEEHQSCNITNTTSKRLSEFTPGKLADESQLGSLTSLMNNNFNNNKLIESYNKNIENNNNNEALAPTDLSSTKPLKKRLLDISPENTNIIKRNVVETEEIKKQDLMNKIDNFYVKQEDYEGLRKSDRSCKGRRYVKFMSENKLLGNKKEPKLTQFKMEEEQIKTEHEMPCKLDLNETIKRLAQRTNYKLENEDVKVKTEEEERQRSLSESSDVTIKTEDFNLNDRISSLPALSYDGFVTRKKESKKRKIKGKSELKGTKQNDTVKEQPIGSKKRKNKSSITHLNKNDDKNDDNITNDDNIANDLLGLATLAEVAAKTEKI